MKYSMTACFFFKANTTLSVLGLRLLSRCDGSHKLCLLENSNISEDALRKSFCIAAMLLPMFAVIWFAGVLALENSSTLTFPLLFSAANSVFVSLTTFIKVILINAQRIHDYKTHTCTVQFFKVSKL